MSEIKIEYSKIKEKTKEELLEMKKTFVIHNMNLKNKDTRKLSGFHMKEIRKNIAKINRRLEETK